MDDVDIPVAENEEWAGLDDGIRRYVKILRAQGVETFESCEGGAGHAFAEPTIRFHGTPEAGWRAMGACLAFGLPILCLRRTWYVLDANEPTGPHWEITFRQAARGAAVLLLALLLPGLANAAETVAVQAPSLDLTAIVLAVIGGVFAVIKIVAESFAASRIKDTTARAVVDKALDNSLGALQQAAQFGVVTAKPHLNLPGVPDGLRAGVQYVLDHAGDEAARLGVTPQALADKISARIGVANIATNLAVSASAAPVVAQPLDPVPVAVPAAA